MDKKYTGIEEIPDEEVTRELLIALSYTEPPKDHSEIRDSLIALSYAEPPDNSKDRYAETLNSDVVERNRSELISISYSPSPEAPAPQALPGGIKG